MIHCQRKFSLALLSTAALLSHQHQHMARAFHVVAVAPSLRQQLYHASRHASFWTTQRRWMMSSTFASPDEIQAALDDARTIILDVRRYDEIVESGYLKTSTAGGQAHQWVHMPCTPTDAKGLEMTASHLLRTKSAPIVVHCAAGKRAAKAKQVLDDLGYENVINAGGFADLQGYMEKS